MVVDAQAVRAPGHGGQANPPGLPSPTAPTITAASIRAPPRMTRLAGGFAPRTETAKATAAATPMASQLPRDA